MDWEAQWEKSVLSAANGAQKHLPLPLLGVQNPKLPNHKVYTEDQSHTFIK